MILELMKQLRDEYFFKILNTEKQKLLDAVKDKIDKGVQFNWKFYTTVVRRRYVDWTKTKFNNFINSNIREILKTDYRPDIKIMTIPSYRKYLVGMIYTTKAGQLPQDFTIKGKSIKELEDVLN